MIAILRTGQIIEANTLIELFESLRKIGEIPRAIVKRGKTW